MKAVRQTDVQVQRTLGGQTVAMGIHADAMAHIMGVLTDLYSDPELAVLREYSTNALDAHVEAGQTRPIEVTLPTALSQFFTVRDFGVGLSFEDIESIYSQYGASTKRESNDVVGMLGLGCKSALTYTDQFILVSVKDGERVQVAISRDSDGSGSMQVVSRTRTTEPNGTTVQVPAKLHNSFASKAADFFRWWAPGTVLVNGRAPAPIEGLRVTDDLMLIEGQTNYCVMGNVAYPIERSHFDGGLGYGSSVAMFVPIGDVLFTPSREALNYAPHTVATLQRMEAKWKLHLPLALQREVDAAPTPREALDLMLKWKRAIPHRLHPAGGFWYKRQRIPTSLESRATLAVGLDPQGYQATMVIVPGDSHVLSRHQKVRSCNIENASEAIIVYGWDRPSFTAGQKKKLNKWAADKGVSPRHYLLLKNKPDMTWLDPDKVVEWAPIEAIKLPRAQRTTTQSGRLPGSYDFVRADGWCWGEPGDKIDQSKPIFYGPRIDVQRYKEALLGTYPDATIVMLTANRIDKFCRNVPSAVKCRDGVIAAADKWFAGINKLDRKALAVNDHSSLTALRRLDAAKVNDPDLKAAIKLANRDITKILKERERFERLVPIRNPEDKGYTCPLDNYPLIERSPYSGDPAQIREHRYIYINAVHAARQAGQGV